MASEPISPVGTTVLMRPSELALFHRNARVGDVDAIMGSLKANGQYKPIVVNIGTHTGRRNEVLAGNHTLKALRNLAEIAPFEPAWQQVSVHLVDVDDDMATRIVLVDNRSFEQGEFDADALVALMQDVGTSGTGYSDDDFDALVAQLDKADQDLEPDGSDEMEPPSLPSSGEPVVSYTIVFDDETQQGVWFEFIKELKSRYPDLTLAERIVEHLNDTAGERI